MGHTYSKLDGNDDEIKSNTEALDDFGNDSDDEERNPKKERRLKATSRMYYAFNFLLVCTFLFCCCIVLLSRMFIESTVLFAGSVISILMFSTFVVAACMFFANEYIAPFKFEFLMVAMSQIYTVIFCMSVSVSVYQNMGIAFWDAFSLHLSSPVKSILIIMTVMFVLSNSIQLVLYYYLSRLSWENERMMMIKKRKQLEERIRTDEQLYEEKLKSASVFGLVNGQ